MNTKMELKMVEIDRLLPAKYNPRKDLQPSDPEYKKIERSMTNFGYVEPIIWNEVTGNVVGGHQRLKILRAAGAREAAVVVVRIDDPQTEKALNIALNKAVGEWDDQSLGALLQDLNESGYDLTVTGFDKAEAEAYLAKQAKDAVADDETDLDANTIRAFVKPGDLWQLGPHRLYCGDATSAADLDTLMGDVKANLVLTDPPYNVAYESADGKSIQNDSMEDANFHAFLLDSFRNWVPHLAEGASAYVFHADTEGLNFRQAFIEAGFYLAGCCVWVKNSLVLGRSPYQWQHEPVLFGWLPNGQHEWYADNRQTTVWEYDKPKRSKDHPTMKPVPLLVYPLANSSAPNAVVLDTFGGSGSTLIACEQMGRICYTMELDVRYASVIVQRYVDFIESSDGVSVLRNGKTYTFDEIERKGT